MSEINGGVFDLSLSEEKPTWEIVSTNGPVSKAKQKEVRAAFEREDLIRVKIYRLMDAFLVEGDLIRSIDRLNQDRHLFVENMMEIWRSNGNMEVKMSEEKCQHEIGRKAIGGFSGHEHIHRAGPQICLKCGKTLEELLAGFLIPTHAVPQPGVEEVAKVIKQTEIIYPPTKECPDGVSELLGEIPAYALAKRIHQLFTQGGK